MRSPVSVLLLLIFFGVAVALWVKSLQKENLAQSSRNKVNSAVVINTASEGPAPPFTGTEDASDIPSAEKLLQSQVQSLQDQIEFLKKENSALRELLQKKEPLPKPTLSPPGLDRNLSEKLLSP